MPEKEVEIFPMHLISHIVGNIKHSAVLTTSLQKRLLLFSNDLILLPCCQEEGGHWTIVGIFPQAQLIVHCDPLPDHDADKTISRAIAMFIAKIDKLSNYEDWNFIPLHNYGLQQSSRAYMRMLCQRKYSSTWSQR